MDDWLARLLTAVGVARCRWDPDVMDPNHVQHMKAFHSTLALNLLSVQGDMFLCLLH